MLDVGQLIVDGHNNQFNGVNCQQVIDQGANNKIQALAQ